MPEQKSKLSSRKLVIAGVALAVIVVAAVTLSGTLRPKSARVRDAERYLVGDLNGLAAAEVVVKMNTGKYTTDYDGAGKLPTIGVNPPVIVVTEDGWSAVVTHKQAPGVRCAIGVGMRNPLSRFARSGKVVCKE